MTDERVNEKTPFRVYSNSVTVSMGAYDIAINFKEQSDFSEDRHLGEVVMSPQHAKVVAHILLDHVGQYEDVFGKIPQKPDDEKVQELVEQGIIKVGNRKDEL